MTLANESVNIDSLNGQSLGDKIFIYQGEENFAQISSENNRVKFVKNENREISLGFKQGNYWYRTSLENHTGYHRSVFFHERRNACELIEIYQDNKLIDSLNYQDTLENRIITIQLHPFSKTNIYIKSKCYVQLSSWSFYQSKNNLIQDINQQKTDIKIILTIFMMCFLVNLMFFLIYRRRVYLYYLIYLSTTALYAVWAWSIVYLPYFTEKCIVGILSIIFACLFTLDFLDLKRGNKFGYKIIQGFFFIFVVLFFVQFYSSYIAFGVGSLFVLFLSTAIIYLAYKKLHVSGKPSDFVFFIGFGTLLLAAFGQVLYWTGFYSAIPEKVLFYGVALENIIMILALGIKINETYKSRELVLQENIQLIEVQSEMHIKSMSDQMKPHFLFNTLNSIKAQILGNERLEAVRSIERLSDLYRYIVNSADLTQWSIKQELKVVEDYLYLQKNRFEERLHFKIDMTESLQDQIHLPCLVLQNLVENSIKHRIEKSENGGIIAITIKIADNDGYHIVVRDEAYSDHRIEQEGIDKKGIGLTNVVLLKKPNNSPITFMNVGGTIWQSAKQSQTVLKFGS